MYRYPSLRVAYIDEKEVREKDKIHKEYYSVLIKAVNGLDEVNFFYLFAKPQANSKSWVG